jgi:hypothetical protein
MYIYVSVSWDLRISQWTENQEHISFILFTDTVQIKWLLASTNVLVAPRKGETYYFDFIFQN